MKKPLNVCLVLALLFVGIAFALYVPSGDQVMFSNYRLIEEGMSEAEVREILGSPRSWSFRGSQLFLPGPWPEERIAKVGLWYSARTGTYIHVGFDDARRVAGKIFSEHGPRED